MKDLNPIFRKFCFLFKACLPVLLFCYLEVATSFLYSQSTPIPEPVEVDFLFHYYEQEGIHSAVTGGLGTEELRDASSTVIVTVPMDSVSQLALQANFNTYTSASTDKIDSRVSSASSKDNRAAIYADYSRRDTSGRQEWGLGAGASIESDYLSTSLSAHWRKTAEDGNREISLASKLYLDTWIVYLPEELRAPGLAGVPTDKRRSFSLSATYRQVFSRRLHATLTGEVVVQQGLLSTPFHRVYFQQTILPDIESLPGWRIKYPIGVRLNYYAADWLILRTYNRIYHDSFDILAYTLNLESPIKLSRFLSVYPFYRFHTQTAARFFKPYGLHEKTATHFTSDYDLSSFISNKYGIGIHYSPISGIGRMNLTPLKRAKQTPMSGMLIFESLSLRYGRYVRNDGLNSYVISGELGFLLH